MYLCHSKLVFKTILAIGAISVTAPVQAAQLTDINETFLQSIRNTGTVTPEVARTGAIMYLSVYDAVNGIDLANNPHQGFQQFLMPLEKLEIVEFGWELTFPSPLTKV